MPRQVLSSAEPIGLLIAVARRRIKQAVGSRVRELGLSPQQFWVLVAVDEVEGGSISDVAERQRMDQPTASRVVAALVRRKLVRLEADPVDGRRWRLRLAERGVDLRGTLRQLAAEIRGAQAQGLTAAEKETLRSLLRKVIGNMDQLENRTPGPAGRRAQRAATGGR